MNIYQIELGGKTRTLRFDVGTLKLIGQKTKQDATAPMEGMEGYYQALYACYYGMLRDYRVQKKDPDFEMADVEQWLDELDYQDMVGIMQAYNDAYSIRESDQATQDDDKKK